MSDDIKIHGSDNFDLDYKHFTKSHFRLPTWLHVYHKQAFKVPSLVHCWLDMSAL